MRLSRRRAETRPSWASCSSCWPRWAWPPRGRPCASPCSCAAPLSAESRPRPFFVASGLAPTRTSRAGARPSDGSGGCFASRNSVSKGRVIVAALLLFDWQFALTPERDRLPDFRRVAGKHRRRQHREGLHRPAEEFPIDAINAVSLADRYADPASRFVAVASNQGRTEGSALVLFLLSLRLPYAKWYTYNPGLQSSDVVQRMMIEGSSAPEATAVVWQCGALFRPDPYPRKGQLSITFSTSFIPL